MQNKLESNRNSYAAEQKKPIKISSHTKQAAIFNLSLQYELYNGLSWIKRERNKI